MCTGLARQAVEKLGSLKTDFQRKTFSKTIRFCDIQILEMFLETKFPRPENLTIIWVVFSKHIPIDENWSHVLKRSQHFPQADFENHAEQICVSLRPCENGISNENAAFVLQYGQIIQTPLHISL